MLLNPTDEATNSRPKELADETVQLIREQLSNETDVYQKLSEVQ